jgi:starch synthase
VGKILFCTAEAAPFAKVGGLGDVAGSLPKALETLGLEPIVVMPRYGFIPTEDLTPVDLPDALSVNFLGQTHLFRVWQSLLPNSTVPVYFIENETYFAHRQGVYPFGDVLQEVEGFLLLSEAIFPLAQALNWDVDIIHAQDWHTAPSMTALKGYQYLPNSPFAKTRGVLTLHNMAYQGNHHPCGRNLLAEGIQQCDWLTAVSPTYAEEILTPEFGWGLEGLVREKQQAQRLTGILNGIDTTLFNPETDMFLPEPYGISNAADGKAQSKRDVQLELGLASRPDLPLIGMVTRLTEQKGLDLFLSLLDMLSHRQAHWVILGAGEPGYETLLREASGRYQNIRAYIGFNLGLAQRIYAGSDFFMMPSRFEPCGLGQLIAMRYGSIPIARATGGLADTIVDEAQHPNQGTGFLFNQYDPGALLSVLDKALAYYQQPQWPDLVQRTMSQEWTWTKSAQQYQALYQAFRQP